MKIADITESSLSRVLSHVTNRNIGIVSASRNENTSKENLVNSNSLKNAIRAAGFGFINVNGSYVENAGSEDEKVVKEKSYLVVGDKSEDSGRLLGFLIAAGKNFRQESIFYKPFGDSHGYLYFTNSGDSPIDVGTFHTTKVGDYYSEMKGREFTFTSLNEEAGFMSRWASSIKK